MLKFWVREVEGGYIVTRIQDGEETLSVSTVWKSIWEHLLDGVDRPVEVEIIVHESQEHLPGPDTRP